MSQGYDKSLYEFYKSVKICYQCGKNSVAKGKTRCLDCLEKMAESQRKRFERETEEERKIRLQKNKERSRKRYQERKSQGLCVNCNKPQSIHSTVYCIDCAIKNQRRNDKKKSGIQRNERSAYGKCYVCNEPVGKCGTMCDKCYSMVCANLPKKMNQSLYKIHKQQNKAIFG